MNPTPAMLTPNLTQDLASVIDALTREYDRLIEHVIAQREGVRHADAGAVERATQAQARSLAALASLEPSRAALVNAAAPLLRRSGRGPLTLRDLAAAAPEPQRTTLMQRAAALRTKAEHAREQIALVRSATSSLIAHMEGLMRHVARQLSHAGTYSIRGRVEASRPVVSALDLST